MKIQAYYLLSSEIFFHELGNGIIIINVISTEIN